MGYRFAGDAATLDASPSEGKTRSRYQGSHVAVIGAGAFGGWTALNLLRKGAKVTLLDTWGPGNARASSGCERRMIHSQLYAVGSTGSNKEVYRPLYMDMITRALQLWRENQERWNRQLYYPCGSLTLQPEDAQNGREALAYMRERGVAVEELSLQDLESRYPQMNLEGVSWGLLDVDSGYLRSRVACQEVFRGFLEEGGEYRQVSVKAPEINGSGLDVSVYPMVRSCLLTNISLRVGHGLVSCFQARFGSARLAKRRSSLEHQLTIIGMMITTYRFA